LGLFYQKGVDNLKHAIAVNKENSEVRNTLLSIVSEDDTMGDIQEKYMSVYEPDGIDWQLSQE